MCAEQTQHARAKTLNNPGTQKSPDNTSDKKAARKRSAPLADELATGAVLIHSVGASTDYEIFVAELCADPAAGELGAFANDAHLVLLSHAWITGKKSAIFSFVLHARHAVSNIVVCTSDAATDDPRLKDTQRTLEIVGTMLKRAKGPVTTYVVESTPDAAEPLKISQVVADTVITSLALFYGLG